MRDVYSPPRRHPHTAVEIQGFHETRDREASALSDFVKNAVGTLSLPVLAAEVLKVGTPVLVMAGSELLRALHPESPGGPKLTDQELRMLAYHAGRELERRLLAELVHLVTERAQQSDGWQVTDGLPVPADAPPTQVLDPETVDLSRATLTTLPPESTLDPGSLPPTVTIAPIVIPTPIVPVDPPKAA
jgi:hypothetical protein